MPSNKKGMTPAGKPKLDIKIIGRVIKCLKEFYPVLLPVVLFCIVFTAIASTMPSIFSQKVIEVIEVNLKNGGDWNAAKSEIWSKIAILIGMYVLSILSSTAFNQLGAYITQGFLCKMRCAMFDKMQNYPIRFFDRNKHGDIMSHYTNDIDTLRQLVSQGLPVLLQASIVVISVFFIMLYYSLWLALIVVVGVVFMILVSGKIGGGSAKYFMRQQQSMGRTEGFVQEMMNGQKVIKVFNHEKQSQKGFDEVNDQLYNDSYRAQAYANSLGPIIMNIGNTLYVIVAIVGGLLLLSGADNFSSFG